MTDQELIKRPLDEEFDTMMEVQRNPCGAWMAIQEQANRIEELVKERDEARHLQSCACNYDTPTDVCMGHHALFERLYAVEREKLEAKLSKAVAGLKPLVQICEMVRDGSGFCKGRYQHEVTDSQWSAWCKQIKTTRAVLAELEGE